MTKSKVMLIAILLCFAQQGFSQSTTITGTVSDNDGVPLPGASIVEKGTTNGTQSDFDGNFAITGDSPVTLVVSYIGFTSQEVQTNGRTTINVQLEVDENQLDEVVIVGYGSQKKESVTGAVTTVQADVVTALPVVNFAESIQGRVPGVQVTNFGGPGVAPIVRIRGEGSVSFGSSPLYVIDGFPAGGLNDIDNNDIESISVLRDASASAIYGSRATNGVVLVTTKKGGYGKKTEISLRTYTGFAQAAKRLDLLNREQYLQYATELLTNAGAPLPSRFGELNTPIFEGADQTYAQTETDYQDEIFTSALVTNHYLSLSGGNESSRFLASAGYFKQEGILLGSEFDRINVRFNSDHKLFNDRFKIGQTLTVATGSRENQTGEGVGSRSQLQHVIRGIPYIPILDPTLPGGYRAPDGSDATDPENPVRIALLDRNFNNNVRIFGTAYASYELFNGLEYKFVTGLDYNSSRGRVINPIYFDGFAGRPVQQLQDNRFTFRGLYLSNQLNYNRTFGKHNIDFLALAERQDSSSNSLNASGSRENNDLEVLRGTIDQVIDSDSGDNTIYSYAARLNYDFDGRYLVSASIRRDGNSKFADGNKYANFPAFSLGWNLAKENFMSGVDAVSQFKLRGSWGQTGFEGIGNYDSQAGIANTTTPVFGGDATPFGATITRLPNIDLEWEITEMLNFGLDLAFLNNRIQFNADWYERQSDNLILAVPLPPSQGFQQNTVANVGSIRNSGLEFQGAYYSKTDKDFTWNVAANISFVDNEVLALDSPNASIFAGSNPDTGGFDITRTAPGASIQEFFGWQVEGIFQNQAEVDARNALGDAAVPYQNELTAPGDLIFRDIDNNGIINDEDRTTIGSFIPDYSYGFSFEAKYKNLSMSMLWNGRQGNEVYSGTKVYTEGMLRLFNAGTAVLNAWTPSNTNTNIPRAISGDPNGNSRTSTRFVEDGSFLRLQNVRLGYELPTDMLGKGVKNTLKNLSFYISGTNLLTITDYSGYDPEIGAVGNTNLVSGIDYGQFPRPRTIIFGIDAKF